MKWAHGWGRLIDFVWIIVSGEGGGGGGRSFIASRFCQDGLDISFVHVFWKR